MSEDDFLTQIRSNQGIIYKLVGLYANDAEEKKDLYQEILLNTWKGWPLFRGNAKLSTWLYRICLNTIFTQKRRPSRIDYKESLESISPVVDKSSIHNDDAVRLRQAIRTLVRKRVIQISDKETISVLKKRSAQYLTKSFHSLKINCLLFDSQLIKRPPEFQW